MSTCTFRTLAMDDIYQLGLVQQCRKLETHFGSNILMKCLNNPEYSRVIVKQAKKDLWSKDKDLIQQNASKHKTLQIAQKISWPKIWDQALEKGTLGTQCTQALLKFLLEIQMIQIITKNQ